MLLLILLFDTLSSLIYKFLESIFSTLCICMQIMVWKTNYVIINENDIMFESLWNSHYKFILWRNDDMVVHGIKLVD